MIPDPLYKFVILFYILIVFFFPVLCGTGTGAWDLHSMRLFFYFCVFPGVGGVPQNTVCGFWLSVTTYLSALS